MAEGDLSVVYTQFNGAHRKAKIIGRADEPDEYLARSASGRVVTLKCDGLGWYEVAPDGSVKRG